MRLVNTHCVHFEFLLCQKKPVWTPNLSQWYIYNISRSSGWTFEINCCIKARLWTATSGLGCNANKTKDFVATYTDAMSTNRASELAKEAPCKPRTQYARALSIPNQNGQRAADKDGTFCTRHEAGFSLFVNEHNTHFWPQQCPRPRAL